MISVTQMAFRPKCFDKKLFVSTKHMLLVKSGISINKKIIIKWMRCWGNVTIAKAIRNYLALAFLIFTQITIKTRKIERSYYDMYDM